ncbi:HDOD domain-containing protein [Ferrovum myxofaciens]|jgi:HD-like signal output (HDOD) protein|uniref:HDOD domain protein n=2 Tax=root TaxID=1 RepID=A0A859A967_9PROT|nr:HDOD domain-containing protein [Ferrovum myxofaciens]MBW8029069.1 HDOD domain-containing protein [Ferrovum sp.]KXW57663.1 HDOD domain protein [Ferrovum myxofaciens]NDU88776.1 HDOD domain-containing protein [Ferrovum sp.]QKE38540.1 MAG: HDOD domain-containing protein [Ferrovum myxofaciens]QWY73732.1 MAG: HDOD domain-containing protein [Ferrovum myxofaciens]
MTEEFKTLSQWVSFLETSILPVSRNSLADLEMLRFDEEQLSVLTVARIVLRDPLLMAHVLRYLQNHRSRHQETEIIEVEQAILVLGLDAFYQKVMGGLGSIEDQLNEHPAALTNLQRVERRAERAADYAREWAIRLNDRRFGEVYVATLLHDLAEMLLWIFAPLPMLKIREAQQMDSTLRSQNIQEEVLGFTVHALQHELVIRWGLPQLLVMLMEDAQATSSRVRNVTLAVNLARHSDNGWDDAALPDDYNDIGQLLRMTPLEVRRWVVPHETERFNRSL